MFLTTGIWRNVLIIAIVIFTANLTSLNSQASLSIQGILKKSNGVAVEDGTYNITFRLYAAATGGSALWTEAQASVEVNSGIYSTILGNTIPLTVPFNQVYYLVQVEQ